MPLEVCNGCGRPAYAMHELVYYCGQEECLKKLVHVIESGKFVDLIENRGNHGYSPFPVISEGSLCRVKPIRDSRVLDTQAIIDAYNRIDEEEEGSSLYESYPHS